MDLCMIRRQDGWKTGEEPEVVAKRSTEVAESDFPDDIRWIRSCGEREGRAARHRLHLPSIERAVRDHAAGVGMPADEVPPIVDTVIVRPDPAPAGA
jgi:hypothetical protein